jgi:hypothetical protein
MSERSYRLTVIACAVSWLMVGMHAPVLHQLTHHDHNPGWAMLAAIASLAAAGVATIVALFRSAPSAGQPPLRPDARG